PRTSAPSCSPKRTARKAGSCWWRISVDERFLYTKTLMMAGHGYKAVYDYVELMVERRENQWRLILKDNKHGETVEHDEEFATPGDAQGAALSMAQSHINIQHNDTLLTRVILSWREY